MWQVIGDKINYVLSERGAASALGGQGGVFKVGCLSGVLLVAIFSLFFVLLAMLVPGAPSAELDYPAKVRPSYLRSWADKWYENGGRLS